MSEAIQKPRPLPPPPAAVTKNCGAVREMDKVTGKDTTWKTPDSYPIPLEWLESHNLLGPEISKEAVLLSMIGMHCISCPFHITECIPKVLKNNRVGGATTLTTENGFPINSTDLPTNIDQLEVIAEEIRTTPRRKLLVLLTSILNSFEFYIKWGTSFLKTGNFKFSMIN